MKNDEILKLFDSFKEDIRHEIGDIKKRVEAMEKTISTYLANRLPVWASVLIAVLTAAIGALFTKLF